MSNTVTAGAPSATPVAARPVRDRLWPLWGVLAGIAGFTATVLLDVRPASEDEAIAAGDTLAVGPEHMADLDRMQNMLGFLIGFVAVAALLVFQAAWRARVEGRFGDSIAARVVSGGFIASAAGLALGFGWKGALANYGYDGPEFGLYGDEGLFVYYMLTDFGPYIPWLGTLVAAAAYGWLAWRERILSRVLGTVSLAYAALIGGAFIVTGVPGLAGPLGGIWLAGTSLWLVVGRSRATERFRREVTA